MPDAVTLSVNGAVVSVPAGAMVSAAIAMAGVSQFRRSVSGEPRGPLCGMGICFDFAAHAGDSRGALFARTQAGGACLRP